MWKIWWRIFIDGNHVGSCVSCRTYKRKGNAVRWAKLNLVNHGSIGYEWTVGISNPWVG